MTLHGIVHCGQADIHAVEGVEGILSFIIQFILTVYRNQYSKYPPHPPRLPRLGLVSRIINVFPPESRRTHPPQPSTTLHDAPRGPATIEGVRSRSCSLTIDVPRDELRNRFDEKHFVTRPAARR